MSTSDSVYQSTLHYVLDRVDNATPQVTGWIATCPGCDAAPSRSGDRHPILSISEREDGRVLLYCHAGCTLTQIVGALSLKVGDLRSPSQLAFEWGDPSDNTAAPRHAGPPPEKDPTSRERTEQLQHHDEFRFHDAA